MRKKFFFIRWSLTGKCFSAVVVCTNFFLVQMCLQDIYFLKHLLHPPPSSEVKCSTPMLDDVNGADGLASGGAWKHFLTVDHLAFLQKKMPLFKLSDAARGKRKAVVADSLEELITKGTRFRTCLKPGRNYGLTRQTDESELMSINSRRLIDSRRICTNFS